MSGSDSKTTLKPLLQTTHGLPLTLSPKPFADFTPQEFADYVRSLYIAPAPKKEPKIRVKKVPKLTASLTKTGKLSLRTDRKPKWALRAEVFAAADALKLPQNEVWCAFRNKDYVIYDDEEHRQKCLIFEKELPW